MKFLKKTFLLGAVLLGEYFFVKKYMENKLEKIENEKMKSSINYEIMLNLFMSKNSEISIAERCIKMGYKSIAIYGMGEIGKILYNELKKSELEVAYAIDSNEAGTKYEDLNIVSLNDCLEPVNAIIVTPVYSYDAIEKAINQVCDYEVLSLDDILF